MTLVYYIKKQSWCQQYLIHSTFITNLYYNNCDNCTIYIKNKFTTRALMTKLVKSALKAHTRVCLVFLILVTL